MAQRIGWFVAGIVLSTSLVALAAYTNLTPFSLQEFAVLLACEDQTHTVCRVESQFAYETVAASQTDQAMGATGATGDLLHAVHCVFTAAPAAVTSIKDGAGSAINIIEVAAAAGTRTVILDMVSTGGAWKITTSSNSTCIGIGRFT